MAPRLAALALLVALAPAPARAQEVPREAVRMVARVMLTSGAGGHFATPTCTDRETLAPSSFALQASRFVTERDRLGQALVVDTGGLLAPHGVARFAAQEDPDALAELVSGLGYGALSFGEGELAAPRAALLSVARALRERRVPIVASNLRCEPEAEAVCDAVVDARDGVPTFDVGEERVAFLSFLDPGALGRVSRANRAGLRLSALEGSVALAVRAARARGATFVLVNVDTGAGQEGASRLLSIANALPDDGKPDVLLGAGIGDRMVFARPPGFRPAIAAAPPGRSADLHVRRNAISGTLDVLVQPFDPAPEAAAPVRRFVERVGRPYCEHWGERLPGGDLDEPLDLEGLLRLSAGILREATGAEIALLNPGVADVHYRPLEDGSLSASDVFIALQYDDPIVVGDVPGSWLVEVAPKLAQGELLAVGLAWDAETRTATVHGRPIEPAADYRVATLRFLAAGGDGLLPPGPDLRVQPELTLRTAVLDYLREPRQRDPRRTLTDPADELEWKLRANTDVGFAGTRVNGRGAGYDDTQLTRDDSVTVGLESTAVLSAVSRLVGWDNTLQARYRVVNGAGVGFDEGDDQLIARSTLRHRGLRDRWEAWYAPEPFVEAYLESELTEAEERGFRHLLLRPVAGFSFALTEHLSLRLAAGLETQLLEPDREVLPGVGAVLTLTPFRLLEEGARRVELSGTLDYFVAGLADENRQTLRGRFDAMYALSDAFALGLSMDLFGVKVGGGPVAVAADATATLRVRWLGRRLSM